VLFRT